MKTEGGDAGPRAQTRAEKRNACEAGVSAVIFARDAVEELFTPDRAAGGERAGPNGVAFAAAAA